MPLPTLDFATRGACEGMDTETFYADPREAETDDERVQAETDVGFARQVCGSCIVQTQCRLYALARKEPYGMWGGLDRYERRRLIDAARRLAKDREEAATA